MSRAIVTNPLALRAARDAAAAHAVELGARGLATALPDDARAFLGRLRLLEGVPFAYLVPDAELTPPESIRFFYLDREWTDAVVEGALSVGTVTTLDRELLQASYRGVRDDVDAEERRQRTPDLPLAPAGPVSGFVLRSRLVSGWPALHVRAFATDTIPDDAPLSDDDPRRVRLLRLERLAPAVLFCLFDGVPEIVHLEEPRQGLQFGVVLDSRDGATHATLPVRDLHRGAVETTASVPIPFRRGAPGVIDVRRLADALAAHPEAVSAPASTLSSAELALQLLRFPYRQVFGALGEGGGAISFGDVFRPLLDLGAVRAWNHGVGNR